MEEAVIQYFSSRSCRHCHANFTGSGISITRIGDGYSASITCSNCSAFFGNALITVGKAMNMGAGNPPKPKQKRGVLNARDTVKFQELGPIKPDEVLDFHEFLKSKPDGFGTTN